MYQCNLHRVLLECAKYSGLFECRAGSPLISTMRYFAVVVDSLNVELEGLDTHIASCDLSR